VAIQSNRCRSGWLPD